MKITWMASHACQVYGVQYLEGQTVDTSGWDWRQKHNMVANGTIVPKTVKGAYYLDDLADVSTAGEANGDVLAFDGTTWVAKSGAAWRLPTGDDATPVNLFFDYTIVTANTREEPVFTGWPASPPAWFVRNTINTNHFDLGLAGDWIIQVWVYCPVVSGMVTGDIRGFNFVGSSFATEPYVAAQHLSRTVIINGIGNGYLELLSSRAGARFQGALFMAPYAKLS